MKTKPFASFSILKELGNNEHLVKLFSEDALEASCLESLFKEGFEVLATAAWNAYPKFNAGQNLPDFSLSEGLYYLNAIESGGSCIEISIVSGRNAALLMKHDIDNPLVSKLDRKSSNDDKKQLKSDKCELYFILVFHQL